MATGLRPPWQGLVALFSLGLLIGLVRTGARIRPRLVLAARHVMVWGTVAAFASACNTNVAGIGSFGDIRIEAPRGTLTSVLDILNFHKDQLGNSAIITDGTGNVVQRTAMGPYGEVKKMVDGAGNNVSALNSKSPVLFTGHYYDWESGMHYANARYLDPESKRFLSLDPALYGNTPGVTFGRLVSSVQATNPHAYVGRKNLNYKRPDG